MTDISYWLMKSEPSVYGINQLKQERETIWDGIRNYQARNLMRNMKVGDKAFFYHSNCNPPGIVGLMEVIRTGLIDPTQFDQNSNYYDSKSSEINPKWDCVKLKYIGKFTKKLTLKEINLNFTIEDIILVRKGNRLSVIPIINETAEKLFSFLGNAN